MNRWIAVFLFCSVFLSHATQKKYEFAVCALFKNEGDHLKEWIEFHRMIGVGHFYLYENGSTDHSVKVLKPYIDENLVTLVHWPDLVNKEVGEQLSNWVLSTQIPSYENAIILYGKKEAKWLVFLDVEEFIIPESEDSILEILRKHENQVGIAAITECFDAGIERVPFAPSLVIDTDVLTKEPPKDVRESVRKVIFQPEFYLGSTWAPYQCRFTGDREAKEIDENILRVNRYVKRNTVAIKQKRKLSIVNQEMKNEILDAGYDIEDQRKSIHRFISKLKIRLNQ